MVCFSIKNHLLRFLQLILFILYSTFWTLEGNCNNCNNVCTAVILKKYHSTFRIITCQRTLLFFKSNFQHHSVAISWFLYHSDFMWNQFWGFLKGKICHFNTFRGSEFWFFMNFCTFWRLKLTTLAKFRAPKMAKRQFYNF